MGKRALIWSILIFIAVLTFSERSAYADESDIVVSDNTLATVDSINIQEATDVTSGDYTYTIENGTAYIKEYNGNSDTVTIPTSWSYGGTTYTIRKVGDSAFEGNTSIHRLIIPSAITSLGKKAFANCTSLESIVINGDIGDMDMVAAFSTYYKNSSVFLGAGANADDLIVTFGEGVTRIPAYIFSTGSEKDVDDYVHLKEINISNTVTEIGKYAFNHCYDLETINWGNGLTLIGEKSFASAENLTFLSFPFKLAQIQDSAFEKCYSLEKVNLPESTISLGNNTFAYCTRIKDIEISGNIGDLEDWSSFSWCYGSSSAFIGAGLNSDGIKVTFNEGVTRIPAYLFATGAEKSVNDYAHIKKLCLPDTLVEIGKCAFYRCYDLEDIEWGDELTTIDENAFEWDESIEELDFPSKLMRINNNAFSNCRGVEDIVLPETLTSLGANAFTNCTKLSSLDINGDLGKVNSSAAYSLYESYSIFINVGENAEDLKVTFGNKVTEIPEYLFATGADKSENVHSHITEISIPVSVNSIGKYAFHHLFDLKKIKFEGTQDRWNQILDPEGNELEGVVMEFEGHDSPMPEPDPGNEPDPNPGNEPTPDPGNGTDPNPGNETNPSPVENQLSGIVVLKGNVVSYNGIRYYMAKTTVPFSDIIEGASILTASSKIVKINVKKGTVKFNKDGNVTLTSDTGKKVDIVVFGAKAEKEVLHVGEKISLPKSVLIETGGKLMINKPDKATISANGVLTAQEKGSIKLMYEQNNKKRTVMRIKIKK